MKKKLLIILWILLFSFNFSLAEDAAKLILFYWKTCPQTGLMGAHEWGSANIRWFSGKEANDSRDLINFLLDEKVIISYTMNDMIFFQFKFCRG